jgi:hypothetical protein
MDTLEKLLAIEDIKATKARYWRGVDMRDAELLRSAFAADAVIDTRDSVKPGQGDQRSREDFIVNLINVLEGVVTVHHGHAPEITVTSATEASAIWPMEDRLWVEDADSPLPFRKLKGWGHYHDTYRKTPDGWRIAYTKLVRIKVETE